MSLPPLPQFDDDYDGSKLRFMTETLQNALDDLARLQAIAFKTQTVLPYYGTQSSQGSTETTLYSGTIVPGMNYSFGWQIKIDAFGTFAGNNNGKVIKLYLNNNIIYNSGTLSSNGGTWSINAIIIITAINAESILITTIDTNSAFPTNVAYSTANITITYNNTINLTGTGTATGDVVGEAMILTLQPN